VSVAVTARVERRPPAGSCILDIGIHRARLYQHHAQARALLLAAENARAACPTEHSRINAWILLSISAGICEELAFRGYLLQQFASIGNRLWLGVLASSLLFGLAHGYEGVSGIIAITAYGAMFCVLAIRRRSLRPE